MGTGTHISTLSKTGRCRYPRRSKGFTFAELIFILGILALLAALAVPVLANTTTRSERVVCANNLRLIAGAYYQWSAERLDRMPWFTPVFSGGTQGHPSQNRTWFQFASISNELKSPRYLADPGDDRVNPPLRLAMRWDHSVNGGLAHPAYDNNALSYGLSLHATLFHPQSLIVVDRHQRNSGREGCSSGINPVTVIVTGVAAWTNAVHREVGNIAFMDGRVEQVGTPGLRRAIDWNNNWNYHFLFPY